VEGFAVLDHVARPTAVVHALVEPADLPSFCHTALMRVLAAMETQRALPSGEPFTLYRGTPDGLADVEVGFPIAGTFVAAGEVVPSELPGGQLIAGIHTGPYRTLAATSTAMRSWAARHGWMPTGEMWEVHLTDPERVPEPSRWRARVFLRVQ
jgi:effector-binding domain-containing protein